MLSIFILLFAVGSLGRRDLSVFLCLRAFVGVADRAVHLAARDVLGASLLLILLGILLKGHQT